jgi:hypothetical protein
MPSPRRPSERLDVGRACLEGVDDILTCLSVCGRDSNAAPQDIRSCADAPEYDQTLCLYQVCDGEL